jgi:transposase-like protein
MSEMRELIERARRKRDNYVRRMIHRGWGPSQIARKLAISRQAAQQIVRRLSNGS